MQRFFECVRDGSRANSILPFLKASTNPGLSLIKLYCSRLRNCQHAFWRPIKEGGWTQYALRTTSSASLLMVGDLFMRFVKPFLRVWPWRAYEICDEDVDIALSALTDLQDARPCCHGGGLGAFTDKAQADVVKCADGAALQGFIDDVEVSFRKCRCVNIESEDRFARLANFSRSCHGKAAHIALIGARHVLAEAAAEHHRAVRHWFKSWSKRDKAIEPEKTFVTGLSAFLHCHPTHRFAEAAASWKGMPPEKKEPYARMCRESLSAREARRVAAPQPRHAEAAEPSDVKIGSGDASWPLRPEYLQGLDPQRQGHRDWREHVGSEVKSCEAISVQTCQQCDIVLEPGVCFAALSADIKDK